MTSPMIDTVRNIPLIIEKDVPIEADDGDSGFPFDREDRDDHLRSQLDDIAKRHPEFAEHFEGFPFRSETLGRRRPPRPSESEFRRFTDRPFGSGRFERLFRDPFDHEEFEEPQHHQPQQQQQEQPQPEQKVEEEEKPKPERSRKQNIQQSNTVDLGQKQEPVNDRNQRSMSAPPPDNRPRYVSSINIPINRDGAVGNMGTQQSQPQQQQPPQPDKPVERVIPIHVEGRDEPVMPKHTGPSFSQPQTERTFGGQRPQERVFEHPPQSERIFGQRPGTFTQFVPPKPQFEPEVKQQQKFQQQASPPPPPPQQQQQPPPQPKATTPIDIIQSIQKDVSELMTQVENFSGQPRDKQYLYLDEMLTRNLIKLDNIDTQGQENIRQARKEAIKCIERCISLLEAKAAANVPQEKKPVEEESQPKEEKMEVEVKEPSPKPEEKIEEATVPPQPNEEKMEVNIEKTDVEEPKIETSELPPPPPQEEKPTSENKPTNEEIIPLPPPAEENTKKDSESNEETSEKK